MSVSGGVLIGGTVALDTATLNALAPLSTVNVDNFPAFPATQTVDGTVALDEATLEALAPPTPQTNALTDTQLRATPVQTIEPITYYASAAGGRVAFNITTQILTVSTSGEVALAALVNPSGSGKDLVLDLGEFGASANTTFRRYRNSTITPTGAALSASNMGGGAASSVAQMYVGGGSPTFTRSGGVVSKTAHIAAYQQYFAYIKGRSVLRPGQSLSWTIQGPQSGNFTASVYFEYYERTAEA